MKKRLRKKKHLGEFRQLGFSVHFRFREGLTDSEFERFSNEFIEHAIEAQGLQFGGGGSPERGWGGVVSKDHRHASSTESDKAAVENWAQGRAEVESSRFSDFWDIWYGQDPF